MSGAQEQEEKAGALTADGAATSAAATEPAQPKPLPDISGPGVRVRYTGRSAVGLVREHNEDNLVIVDLSSGEVSPREETLSAQVGPSGWLFAVCDGMGGAAAGEVASQMAVDILQESMRRGGAPADRDTLARRLVTSVEEAGKRIFEGAQKERSRRGMGTTATVAVLMDKVLFLAEVGDSRAYLLRHGALKQLTKDQSLVNQLIEAGHLTEAEAEAFEHSNIILQALGTAESVQVDLTFVELRKGDRLMMCSDGLSGLVHADSLREALSSITDPAECTATLIKYAEAGGGHDNITVVVVDFDGDALDAPRDNDSFGYVQYPLLPADGAGTVVDEEITDAGMKAAAAAAAGSESPIPDTLPPSDAPPDRSAWLWVSAGLVALLIGAWVLAVSSSGGNATAHAPVPEAANTLAPTARIAEAAEPKPVAVRVFSDVEGATLLVNGEARGALGGSASRDMQLRPGAYRFEAQSNGNIAAVEVVTVRPDVPLDVYLRLPSGTSDPAARKPAAAPNEQAEPSKAADEAQAPAAQPKAVELAPQPQAAPALAQPKSAGGGVTGKSEAVTEGSAAPAAKIATKPERHAHSVPTPQAAQTAPSPAVAAPKPAVATPTPAVAAPKPAVATPKPAVSAPKAAATKAAADLPANPF